MAEKPAAPASSRPIFNAVAALLAIASACSGEIVVGDPSSVTPGSGGSPAGAPPNPDPSGNGGSGAGGAAGAAGGGESPARDAGPGPGGAPGGPARDAAAVVDGCAGGAMPADVAEVLRTRCQICHGNPPLATVPGSLVTADDFRRPATSAPGRSTADVVVARITSTLIATRMPPAPGDPLSPAETQILRRWVESGMPLSGCAPPTAPPRGDGGGAPPPPDAAPNPFAVPPMCTSGTTWRGGTGGSGQMQPGVACINCHIQRGGDDDGGPLFLIAGTVYPSAHEPNLCNGTAAQGATVVVTDGTGASVTARVNAAGNFYANDSLRPPFRAKVVFMGRERIMLGAVPIGDCNRCHTQNGTTTVAGAVPAPGRILLP